MARLILASGSAARRQMLQAAGLTFRIVPAEIDEDILRERFLADDACLAHARVAERLAEHKALDVSRRHPDALVIGSDQVLSTGEKIFSKPATLDEARAALKDLRGRSHHLHSGVALAEGGRVLWQTIDTARLTMHDFSDTFLESYLEHCGADILGCVGAYQLEGAGIRLFDEIEGSHFTILGMPLVPLLKELRLLKEILI